MKILKLVPLWSGYYVDRRWPWCEYLFGNGSLPVDDLKGWEGAADEPFMLIYPEVLRAIPDAKHFVVDC